jgi:GNAT superfamily N-acetyltransferase
MRIVDLTVDDARLISEAAALLIEGFAGTGLRSWSTLDDADAVVGWIGGISSYAGLAWELHPVVVRPNWRRRGVGRELVADLEEQVGRRGAVTLYLGRTTRTAERASVGETCIRAHWMRWPAFAISMITRTSST